MANTEKSNEHEGMKSDPPGEPFVGEHATACQQLLRFKSDIERQGHQVARAVHAIADAIGNGEDVSLEMLTHVKAQILKAHLQLDDLEECLDSIA